jgi:folate-dependent phosphoribosylglycinamide formyltransferase PurN
MKKRVVLITCNPGLVARFLEETEDRLEQIGVTVPLAILIYPSMRFKDRLRDLRRTIRRQARIIGISQAEHLIHHFGYRWFKRSHTKAQVSHRVARLKERLEVVRAESANDRAVVELIRGGNFDFGMIFGADQLSGQTLEDMDIPLFNTHLSDPAFARGRPPIIWEILDDRDSIHITLHQVVERLDGGDVMLQNEVAIDWRATLDETLHFTRERADRFIIEQWMDGIERICDDSATFRSVPAGPLRTTPTIPQLLKARRICRKKWEAAE